MEIYSSVDNLSKNNIESSSLTIGTFDGMHLGHQHLIKELIGFSLNNNNKSIIITFNPNPYSVINKDSAANYSLISNNDKYEILDSLGVDVLMEIPFDLNISRILATNFLEDFIVSPFKPKDIIIGYDHHFGYKREGDSNFLTKNSKKYGYSLHVVAPFKKDDRIISSSMIRNKIAKNDILSVNDSLGRSYKITGSIVKGNSIGRSISFPTANISLSSISQIIPANGVYLIKAYINSDKYMGMCNIGYRPTISDGESRTVEVHLFDYSKFDLYGEVIKIEFVNYIRSEMKFGSKEELKGQLIKDKEYCKSLII